MYIDSYMVYAFISLHLIFLSLTPTSRTYTQDSHIYIKNTYTHIHYTYLCTHIYTHIPHTHTHTHFIPIINLFFLYFYSTDFFVFSLHDLLFVCLCNIVVKCRSCWCLLSWRTALGRWTKRLTDEVEWCVVTVDEPLQHFCLSRRQRQRFFFKHKTNGNPENQPGLPLKVIEGFLDGYVGWRWCLLCVWCGPGPSRWSRDLSRDWVDLV